MTIAAAASGLTGALAQAVTGPAAANGAYAFTAQLAIGGGERDCSAVLVDPLWVLTDSNCFADKPGAAVAAGKPKLKTTATVGRTDLNAKDGHSLDVTELVPNPDRGLVMARLSAPATGVAPVALADSAPTNGEILKTAGFGRTETEWIPDKLHTAAFAVGAVAEPAVSLSGKTKDDAICKGDAGGPVLRERAGRTELVALSSASNFQGCLGETKGDAPSLASATRTDGAADWIQQVRLSALVPDVTSVMTTGDFNGDGRTDIAAVTKDGNLHAFYGRADGTFQYGRPLWTLDGSWKSATKIIGGDFNGDGHTDIAAVWSNGSLRLYAADVNGNLTANKPMWVDEETNWNDMIHLARFNNGTSNRDGLLAVWGGGPKGALYAYEAGPSGALTGTKRNMWRDATWQYAKKITTGDFNGDGRDDVVTITDVGGLSRYTRYDSNAGGGLSDGVSMWRDNSWGATQVLLSGDFDGDSNTDIGSLWSNQQRFNFYKGDGKGNLAEGANAWPRL
ncbi:FG-GAP-like repeat-containing protein [Streptomyces sp. NPDC020883]|uniref:FG-GAP-like repeat-containing protein n=1 Tax=Streptomyces sp. NPDC020883 TaxID=3365099 RepID=UPI0037BDF652